MITYSKKDFLETAVEKVEELQLYTFELKAVMPNADYNRLARLVDEVARNIVDHSSLIIRET